MPVVKLSRGITEKLFDALTTTVDTKGATFSMPAPSPGGGNFTIGWRYIPNVAPSAISLQLQGSHFDVDSEFVVLDTTATTTGDAKVVTNVPYRFIRPRQVSRTGGTDITVQVTVL